MSRNRHWHIWFAWYPVDVMTSRGTRRFWLCKLLRRWRGWGVYEYREITDQMRRLPGGRRS